jgi:hypothetical protein
MRIVPDKPLAGGNCHQVCTPGRVRHSKSARRQVQIRPSRLFEGFTIVPLRRFSARSS